MISLRHISKPRTFVSSVLTLNNSSLVSTALYCPCCFASSAAAAASSSVNPWLPPASALFGMNNLVVDEVVDSFKDWFKSGNIELFDRIYEILSAHAADYGGQAAADLDLSRLGLRLNEAFVLEVLRYGKDVFSCLKFFDWAGRQPGFSHTRSTFYAIFKILSRAKLMPVMIDFLQMYRIQGYPRRARFYDTLVMGYAVAGRTDIALQLFGKMRFQGIDLDHFTYHVFLNALVEEKRFDEFEVILKQIQMRGYENEVTNKIVIKSYCKRNQLNEAEAYLDELLSSGKVSYGCGLDILVDAFCQDKMFMRAKKLVEKLQDSGLSQVENAYGVLIRELVRAGRLNEALELFQCKKSLEGYVPDLFWYNTVIKRLLRKNRLHEVYNFLMEMKENCISPDMVTVNAVFCFFCKAGMGDVALKLYYTRAEFGLSPSQMAYKYLINYLCFDGSIVEAYNVLKNSINQGFSPDRRTSSRIMNALYRECKVDQMKELFILSLEQNFVLSASAYEKLISALCLSKRVEDAYLIHAQLPNVTTRTYFDLISGFSKLSKGDIAGRLLIEMQERAHIPTRSLVRAVINSILDMDNSRTWFFNLLDMQLSRYESNCLIYDYFIDGAGHAKKPELAREVFEMMQRNGIKPNLTCKIHMLQSYFRSEKISDGLNFFSEMRESGTKGTKLYNVLVVGLSKAKKVDIAVELLSEMRENKLTPSVACYEILVQELCRVKRYDVAINIINEYEKMGRPLTSFLGNVLLWNSLTAPELYDSCVHLRGVSSVLSLLIGAFSGRLRVDQQTVNFEELIQQCFPLDLYTYNLLLRKESMNNMEKARELFDRICQKGYEPNQWTYEIMVRGFLKHGRKSEAKSWIEEMLQRAR
ncbi:hypothetical protein L6164_031353 [Bauhinia variegata]|uniref:Uncharacterized protein n=1 Tax=Bauhinia variegata TaxID=167791 RepID=A0ACB9LF77_BAUVA|nr:hypothetical protein L6164_031353 [Bauhinia variegata]